MSDDSGDYEGDDSIVPDFTERDYCARCGTLMDDDYGLAIRDMELREICVDCADDIRNVTYERPMPTP